VYAAAGRRNEAMAFLDELEARRKNEYVIPTADILISVPLGDRDRTYKALVAGVDEGITGCAVEIWIAPYLHDLAGEPRFVDLFEKLRMVPRTSQT
jgi:hypothetical protein